MKHPDADISPIRMKTMHHLPQIFFDTLRAERPDCPILIPNTFSVAGDRLIAQDLYSYSPCGLPTGDLMPAEQAQIRLMTASPVTLRALIPAPDQVTPEQAYYSNLNFYKKTLFHTPFLSRGRAITLNEYRRVQILLEVDAWFKTLPSAVQRYLLPLQSQYTKWFNETVRDLQQNYAWCKWCKQKTANLQRHFMQHHTRWRTIWFCPLPCCPVSSPNKESLVKHLQSKQHSKGMDVICARALAKDIVHQNCFWPVNQTFADKLLRLIRYVALYSMAGVAMEGRMFRIPSRMDVGFVDACAVHRTPKMALSQVLPSGANLRRVAIEPRPTRSPTERPSASTHRDEDENVAEASALQMDLVTPLFQPLRGETGRTWFANEYGITPDNSSLMSSESATERKDSDEEILSFDLGPEPYDPLVQERLPSDEWLDDLQQGLIPPGSEPKVMDYDPETHEMPVRPSLIDTMHQDMAPKVDTCDTTPIQLLCNSGLQRLEFIAINKMSTSSHPRAPVVAPWGLQPQ